MDKSNTFIVKRLWYGNVNGNCHWKFFFYFLLCYLKCHVVDLQKKKMQQIIRVYEMLKILISWKSWSLHRERSLLLPWKWGKTPEKRKEVVICISLTKYKWSLIIIFFFSFNYEFDVHGTGQHVSLHYTVRSVSCTSRSLFWGKCFWL